MLTRIRNSLRDAAPREVTAQYRWTKAGIVGLIGVTALLVLLLYAASVHSFSGDSDGATVMLEGQSMSAGHLTLSGWAFTLESFWSVDAVIYAAVIRVVGPLPELLHVVPAIIASFAVILGAILSAKGRRRTTAAVAAVTVVALVGLPSLELAYYLLSGPLHVATALWCLIAFAGLARARFGWGWAIAVVFLAAGLLGDFMTLAIGVIPVLIAGLLTMLRSRNWRVGIALVAAALSSIILAFAVHEIARVIGTFVLVNRSFPVNGAQITWNLRHLPVFLAELLGVGSAQSATTNGPVVLQIFHVAGLCAFAAGIIMALVNLVRSLVHPSRIEQISTPLWRLDDLLLLGILGDLSTFVVFSPTQNANGLRYLTPSLIFGAILAARAVSRGFESLQSIRGRRIAVAFGAIIIVTFGLDVTNYLVKQAPTQPAAALATFLEHHNLTAGVGDYWSASIVTVETEGAVIVRPVTADLLGHFFRDNRQSSAIWYAGQPFNFFVYDTTNHERDVDRRYAAKMFGKPMHVFVVGTYRVLTWAQPLIFSPSLPPQPSPLDIGS